MKKNKGFTLIELLAVIIIIGLLAVLIIPKINKTLNDSRKKVNEASTKGLLRTADNYYLEQKMKGNFEGCSYDFTNNINTCDGLEFSGEKPEIGKLTIDKNGKIGLAIKFDDTCYVKKYNLDTFIEINNDEIECGENTYYIPQLAITGDGIYEAQGEEGRLIYRGGNPNNYIWLDENADGNKSSEELYRIISYENDGTIKVVRENPIDNIPWDKQDENDPTTGPRFNENNTYCNFTVNNNYCGCNAWSNTSNTYYNGKTLSELNQDFYFYYYSSKDSTSFATKPNNYYGTVTTEASLNIYLNNTWINTLNFKNNIESHSFNIGGIYYSNDYTGGDKGLLKEKQEEQTYKWIGKIALLNITEHIESSTNPNCTSVWANYSQNPNIQAYRTNNEWPCNYENYNYKSEYNQSTLTAISTYPANIFAASGSLGFANSSGKTTSLAVRPAFYLKSDVILSGTGTESDPYQIENI